MQAAVVSIPVRACTCHPIDLVLNMSMYSRKSYVLAILTWHFFPSNAGSTSLVSQREHLIPHWRRVLSSRRAALKIRMTRAAHRRLDLRKLSGYCGTRIVTAMQDILS